MGEAGEVQRGHQQRLGARLALRRRLAVAVRERLRLRLLLLGIRHHGLVMLLLHMLLLHMLLMLLLLVLLLVLMVMVGWMLLVLLLLVWLGVVPRAALHAVAEWGGCVPWRYLAVTIALAIHPHHHPTAGAIAAANASATPAHILLLLLLLLLLLHVVVSAWARRGACGCSCTRLLIEAREEAAAGGRPEGRAALTLPAARGSRRYVADSDSSRSCRLRGRVGEIGMTVTIPPLHVHVGVGVGAAARVGVAAAWRPSQRQWCGWRHGRASRVAGAMVRSHCSTVPPSA